MREIAGLPTLLRGAWVVEECSLQSSSIHGVVREKIAETAYGIAKPQTTGYFEQQYLKAANEKVLRCDVRSRSSSYSS